MLVFGGVLLELFPSILSNSKVVGDGWWPTIRIYTATYRGASIKGISSKHKKLAKYDDQFSVKRVHFGLNKKKSHFSGSITADCPRNHCVWQSLPGLHRSTKEIVQVYRDREGVKWSASNIFVLQLGTDEFFLLSVEGGEDLGIWKRMFGRLLSFFEMLVSTIGCITNVTMYLFNSLRYSDKK